MKDVLSLEERIIEMFASISNVEMRDDDGPFRLCGSCEDKLIVSYSFRLQCQNSHRLLTEHLEELRQSKDLAEVSSAKSKAVPRLPRFDHDQVSQAIESTKSESYKNTICGRCGFTTANTRALSIHINHVHKDLKGRWCSKCNEEFDNLTDHQKTHSAAMCQLCGKQFRSKGHLMEHLRGHSDLRPYPCSSCEKSFISQRHLNVHLRTHTHEKPFKCNVCGKSYNKYFYLREHHKEHNNIDVVCDPQNFCGKCCKNVRSLKEHNLKLHSNQVEANSSANTLCTVCGKQFRSATKLKVHMRTHTGEMPYKCTYCEKKFTTRYQLVVHERTHTGERPHVCHVCGKSFTQSSVLSTHMRRHTGRPIECKICHQGFCRPAELQLHLRKHTGEKPYLCTECGQAFIQRSHLVEHNKTHSDFRAYQCNECDKAFKQRSSLKVHLRIHSGEKPYKCIECGYTCRQNYALTQHMKMHDGEEKKPEDGHSSQFEENPLNSHLTYSHNMVYMDISNAHAGKLVL